MEDYMQPYIVYVMLDERGLITSVNSSAFIADTDGWTEIDRGYTQSHHHAQGNYFDKSIEDDRGIKRYRSVPRGDAPDRTTIVEYVKEDVTYIIYERTQEEMDSDYIPLESKPTLESRVENVENKSLELAETLDMILSGVTSDE